MRDFLSVQRQLTPLDKIETAAQRAQDYVQNPSGPGDAALLFAFVDATRPGGFRFNQAEQQLIIGLRGIVDGAQARIAQGYQGTVLSPDQRAAMAQVIQMAANQAADQRAKLLSGAGAINPTASAAAGGKGPAPRKTAAPSAAAAPSKGPAPKKAATATDDLNQRLQDAYGGQQQ